MEIDLEKLKRLIEDDIKKENMVVDNIEFVKNGNYNFLRITLDRMSGIDLDGIVLATNIINPIIDKNINIDDSFILDVISKERGGN